MLVERMKRLALVTGAVALLVLLGMAPVSAAPRLNVGITGEYVTGYNGLLARWGIPHALLLDHQLRDPAALRRYDMILTSELPEALRDQSMDALLTYVREGGILVLDGPSVPPESVVAGDRGRLREAPGIAVPAASPLGAILGGEKQFPASRHSGFLDPGDDPSVIVLARFSGSTTARTERGERGRPGRGEYEVTPTTPAIWAKPLGKGMLVYSGPGIAYTISLEGADLVPLAEALIRYLGKEGVEPQLVPEGMHLGRKENARTLRVADVADRAEAPDGPAPTARPKPRVPAGPLPSGVQPVEDADPETPEYNLSGTYSPDKGRAAVLLNYWSAAYHVSVSFERGKVRLARIAAGKEAGSALLALPSAGSVPFVLKERSGAITLAGGGTSATLAAPGLWQGAVGVRGEAVSDLRFQPVEPALFTDDFMRTAADQGAWNVVAGEWTAAPIQTPELGANPFVATGVAKGAGLALAGYGFWDDYVVQAAVKPASDNGAAGLGFYGRDAENCYLFRVRLAGAPGALPDGIELVRVAGGKEQLLARAPGCLVKGQWYRLAAAVRGAKITAAIDGRLVLSYEDPALVGGKVALYLRDATAHFDDVEVRPSLAPAAAVALVDAPAPKYAGSIDLDSWAAPATQWDAEPGKAGLFWRRGQFHGDFRLSLRLPQPGNANHTLVAAGTAAKSAAATEPRAGLRLSGGLPRLTLILTGDRAGAESGYALRVRGAAGGRYEMELARRGVVVARAQAAAGDEPLVALQRVGKRVQGSLDGRPLIDYADAQPLPGQVRLGFLAEGCRPRISDLRLQAGQVMNYTFERAPTDWWVGSGSWELTNRWSCAPEWSWFGGMSRDVAAIWHKRRFTGDLTLDYYVGPRMMDDGRGRTRETCRDFNVVLCGDGRDVLTGYTFVVAEGDESATVRVLRAGKLVATHDAFRIRTVSHNRWFNVRAQKEGATIRLFVEGHLLVEWTDPEPLQSGYTGIWTRSNGVMIPRVTLFHQGTGGPLLQ